MSLPPRKDTEERKGSFERGRPKFCSFITFNRKQRSGARHASEARDPKSARQQGISIEYEDFETVSTQASKIDYEELARGQTKAEHEVLTCWPC